MGDINFDIFKDVDLNKTVNLEINKDVTVTVVNPDQLATAEADAEAFGPNALAEVDAYTLVTREGGEPARAIGLIDALGNSSLFDTGSGVLNPENPIDNLSGTPNPEVPGEFNPPLIAGSDGAADTIIVNFTTEFESDPTNPDAEIVPNVDDINGFGKLAPFTSPPPDTPDAPLVPDGGVVPDFVLNQTGTIRQVNTPQGIILEAVYELENDVVVTFLPQTVDLNGDGTRGTGELTFTVPAGTLFQAEYIGNTQTPPQPPPNGAIELEFLSLGDPDEDGLLNGAYWTFDADPNNVEIFDGNPANQLPGEFIPGIEVPAGTYLAPAFELVAESLQDIDIANISDWAFEAEGIFYNFGGDGTAFAYAESTAALDIA